MTMLQDNYNRKCKEIDKKSENMHSDTMFESKLEKIDHL